MAVPKVSLMVAVETSDPGVAVPPVQIIKTWPINSVIPSDRALIGTGPPSQLIVPPPLAPGTAIWALLGMATKTSGSAKRIRRKEAIKSPGELACTD
jgi:hypothetical protein